MVRKTEVGVGGVTQAGGCSNDAAFSVSARRAGFFICQLALLLTASAVTSVVQASQQEPVCHVLLMDFECTQYRQQILQAKDAIDRSKIIAKYAMLQAERRRACPISDKAARNVQPILAVHR